MNDALKFISVLSLCILFTQASIAQEGWEKSKENEALVYIPTDIKSGKVFRYTINLPIDISKEDEKTWLLNYAKEHQNSLGSPLKPWKITPEKTGGWGTTNMYVNVQGEKMSVGYQSKTLANGKVYILQMISSSDLSIILKYGRQINKISSDAESTFRENPPISTVAATPVKGQKQLGGNKSETPKTKLTAKEKRLAIERAIRTTPGKGARSSEIAAVWIDSGINVLWGGIDVDTYLLFKDGTVYMDCEIPPNELLVEESKRLQVAGEVYKRNKWSSWRRSGVGYQIKKRDGSWEKLDGNNAIMTKRGEKLNAKFITASGSQMYGSHRSWITFKPNGTFELEKLSMMTTPDLSIGPSVSTVHKSDRKGTSGTTVVSGTDIGGGTTSKKKDGSKNTGTYYLNGYTITLKHDNGYEHTELFFFDKSNKKSFIYKDDRFWVEKK